MKRSIAALLVMTMCITVFSFPISASTSTDLNEVKQQIEYYESVGDYDSVEKIVDETLPELFHNTTYKLDRLLIIRLYLIY